MRELIWRWPLLLLVIATGLGVCSLRGAGQSTASDDYGALAEAPAKASLRRNPREGDAQARAAGKKLFLQHCAECHGSDADGGSRAPSLRVDEVQQATAGTLFWILTNGVVRRGMPVWSKLPEPQRWQIVTYLRTLENAPASTKNAQ
jgi:mono/diheme cytochrome c family protein